jgi:hypothetical protein
VVEEAEYPERTTDPEQATGQLYHLRLRVECTFCCCLQSCVRTHAVLVIGLYELLDPTTELIEPPRPPIKNNNQEKLASYCTYDKEKQNKNTTRYVLETTMPKQTQAT